MVESGWKPGRASFLAVASLAKTPEEHYKEMGKWGREGGNTTKAKQFKPHIQKAFRGRKLEEKTEELTLS